MDRPGRNFLTLLALAVAFAAYSLCGFIAFVALPLIDGDAGGRNPLLHLLPALVLASVLIAGAWRGTRSLRKHLAASRKLSEKIAMTTVAHPPQLRAAVESAGLEGRVDLVDDEGTFSFAYGLLVPRIAVSRGFLERLGDRELHAALAHERYHVRNLDPLRSLIAVVVSDSFFLLPSFGRLRSRYEASRELAADVCSERACGRRALLAALLSALDEEHSPAPVIGPSLATPALLDARLRRLETGQAPRLPGLDLPTLIRSACGIAAFTLLFALALVGIGGPGMLGQAISSELNANTNVIALACFAPLFALPMLAFWQVGRRGRRLRRSRFPRSAA